MNLKELKDTNVQFEFLFYSESNRKILDLTSWLKEVGDILYIHVSNTFDYIDSVMIISNITVVEVNKTFPTCSIIDAITDIGERLLLFLLDIDDLRLEEILVSLRTHEDIQHEAR